MMSRRMVGRCAREMTGRSGWGIPRPMISFCTVPPRESEGAASMARHPLDRLHPGWGDGCREAELVFGGDGPYGPPPGYARQRGRRMPADAPLLWSRLRLVVAESGWPLPGITR